MSTHRESAPAAHVPGTRRRVDAHVFVDAAEHGSLDPRARWDAQRAKCPVMHDIDHDTYTLLSQRAVREAACDVDTFSSGVSRFLQVPNGLDGAAHASFRAVIERQLTSQRVREIEPGCQQIATDIVDELLPHDTHDSVDVVWQIGAPYAVRSQINWLMWQEELVDTLLAWMRDHRAALDSGDPAQLSDIADRFDDFVRSEIERRRQDDGPVAMGDRSDPTRELMDEQVAGEPLSDAQIVSILRNFTAGDLGTLAVSVGVIVHALATDTALQDAARTASDRDLEAMIDELLRIDDPFLANRRITTRDVEIDGVTIPKGSRVQLAWTAANRDPDVFASPDRYAPDEHAEHNLVYGVGPHVCPGRALATMELRVIVRALLAATSHITLDVSTAAAAGAGVERNHGAIGGYRHVPIRVVRAHQRGGD